MPRHGPANRQPSGSYLPDPRPSPDGYTELDVGELGNVVDREEHVELALGKAQLTVVGVHVVDGGFCELALELIQEQVNFNPELKSRLPIQ